MGAARLCPRDGQQAGQGRGWGCTMLQCCICAVGMLPLLRKPELLFPHPSRSPPACPAGRVTDQQATPSVRQSAQQPGRTDSASPPLKVARRMHSAGGAGSGFASSSLDARMAAAEGSGGGGGGGEQAGGSVPSTSAPGGGAAASREGAAAAGLCARDADEALLRLHHLAAVSGARRRQARGGGLRLVFRGRGVCNVQLVTCQ